MMPSCVLNTDPHDSVQSSPVGRAIVALSRSDSTQHVPAAWAKRTAATSAPPYKIHNGTAVEQPSRRLTSAWIGGAPALNRRSRLHRAPPARPAPNRNSYEIRQGWNCPRCSTERLEDSVVDDR
jgi:hypothetical protein